MKIFTPFWILLLLLQTSILRASDFQVILDPQNSIDSQGGRGSEFPTQINAEGLTISLSSSSIQRGHVFWIEVKGQDLNLGSQAWTELDDIPTQLFPWTNSKGESVLAALVGIPFSEKPGATDVRLVVNETGRAKKVNFKVKVTGSGQEDTTELLNLPEERVALNTEEQAQKFIEDDREIDRAFDIRSDNRTWNQPLALPFNGNYRITSPYGQSRIYSSRVHRRIHWGLDFAVPSGRLILSSLAGTVVLAKEFLFMGKTVVVDHGFGLMTVYSHLDSISVKTGQAVGYKQKIGKSGVSGKSTGPLLHWQVVTSGVKVDPLSVQSLLQKVTLTGIAKN